MVRVTIYTTAICPFCVAVKRMFDSLEIAYEEIPLDADPTLRQRLSEETGGWRTVPMIFVGDRFIGGFAEVRSLHNQGRLIPMVETGN